MGQVAGQAVGTEFEVIEAEGVDYGQDDIVVRHVHVEGLVKGELGFVVVVGVVNAGVACGNQLMLQAGSQFEDVADALGAAGR